MKIMDRRAFLKVAGATVAGLSLPKPTEAADAAVSVLTVEDIKRARDELDKPGSEVYGIRAIQVDWGSGDTCTVEVWGYFGSNREGELLGRNEYII